MKEKLSNKIKKILAFFGATLFVALPSAGCSNQKEETKDNKSKIEENTDLVQRDDKISKDGDTYIVENKTNNTNDFRESIKYTPKEKYVVQNLSYEQMYEMLNNKISEKNFSEEATELLRFTFDEIYKNYDSWKEFTPDLPSKEEYLVNKIAVLDKVLELNVYDEASEKGMEIKEIGLPDAYTTDDNKITMLYDKTYLTVYGMVLAHELKHVEDSIGKDILFETDEDIFSYIISEGGATAEQQYAMKPITGNNCFDYYTNENRR